MTHSPTPPAPSRRTFLTTAATVAAGAAALSVSPGVLQALRGTGTETAAVRGAYLQITLQIAPADRPAAAAIYQRYKAPFLTRIRGAISKELLVRADDVQVLHGFASPDVARAYLQSDLFTQDVVVALKPLLQRAPDVRVYTAR